MKIIEKTGSPLRVSDIEIGDVLVHRGGAKYIVVGTQFSVRCLRLDNNMGKEPFSLTASYNNTSDMIKDLFGYYSHELKLVKDAEIHI